MRAPRAPAFLVGLTSLVEDVFPLAARASGLDESRVDELAAMLPPKVRSATAFYDRLTGFWRYDFGLPITGLPADQAAIGTWMFPPLLGLPQVLDAAQRRLSREQLRVYLARLDLEESHEDMRAEFAPILRLRSETVARYEVSQGPEHPSIDWTIEPTDGPAIVLEVKNRIRDLVEALGRMARGERNADGGGPVPLHDPKVLFRSVAQKFSTESPPLRGAWILTCLSQPRQRLHAVFNSYAERFLDFAFLHNGEDEAYLLNRSGLDREYLLRTFGIPHSERLVLDEPAS